MIKLPFEKLVKAMESAGMSQAESILRVQSRIDNFINEKQQLIQRADIETNETARLSNTAQITLATVLVPLIGFVFSQDTIIVTLSDIQKVLILTCITLLFTSIVFGILAHRSGSAFFKRWADGSQRSLKYANDNVDTMESTGELYSKFDEKMIELKLIEENQEGTRSSTSVWDNLQFISVILSGIFIIVLFYTILFNVPLWRN